MKTTQQINNDIPVIHAIGKEIRELMNFSTVINDREFCEEIFAADSCNFLPEQPYRLLDCNGCTKTFKAEELHETQDSRLFCEDCNAARLIIEGDQCDKCGELFDTDELTIDRNDKFCAGCIEKMETEFETK